MAAGRIAGEANGPRVPPPWRGSGWIVATSLALVAISRWLSATSIEYLAFAITATVTAGALVPALHPTYRRWAAACVAAMAMSLALAGNTQHQLARIQNNWPAERARMSDAALEGLTTRVAAAASDLRDLATQALAAPADRVAAFHQLSALGRGSEQSIVLFRGDSALAWSGRSRVRTDSLTDPIGVVGTPFYLALFASARGNGSRAVATRLLSAESPADRLTPSLAGDVATSAGIAGFRFVPPADSATLG